MLPQPLLPRLKRRPRQPAGELRVCESHVHALSPQRLPRSCQAWGTSLELTDQGAMVLLFLGEGQKSDGTHSLCDNNMAHDTMWCLLTQLFFLSRARVCACV